MFTIKSFKLLNNKLPMGSIPIFSFKRGDLWGLLGMGYYGN